MSLAQYASPYNNDESEVDNNKNQKNQSGKKMSAVTSSSLSSSSLRKTIKRPLQQQSPSQQPQSQQSQSQQPQSQQSQSRVSDFMNKLNSHATTSTTSYIGDDDGGSPYGPYGDSEDLADYIPTTDQQQQQQQQTNQPSHDNNNDNAVTKENFMDLPSSYAKQYYQQYIPHGQSAFKTVSENASPQKDELLEKMNHIIHMLEEQQDEKTGNVTEELILYCFLGVFVIFVVDSFARAGKYVR